jgi:hypothetical protein
MSRPRVSPARGRSGYLSLSFWQEQWRYWAERKDQGAFAFCAKTTAW